MGFHRCGGNRGLIVQVEIETPLYSCPTAHREGVWRMEILLHSFFTSTLDG